MAPGAMVLGEDMWTNLLSSLQNRATGGGNRHVVVLGTPKSGKSTLLAKMGDVKDVDKTIQSNPGIEFRKHVQTNCVYQNFSSYLTVRDEERESIGLIGVHSTSYKHFLPQLLTKERLPSTLVVLNLPMDNPWNLDDELFYWTSLLERHIQQLGIEESEMTLLRQNVVDLFASYKSPEKKEEESDETLVKLDEEDIDVVLPLPSEALVQNLGVPIIIVLNKVDSMSTLQKEHDFSEEHFEFIQWHLRTICLSYGAGLLYCSPRENSNTKLLLDYICHLFYDLKFTTLAQVVDKDAIFVPIGWDSPTKMALVSDGFIQFSQDKAYADQITPLPDIRKKRHMKGEDDQTFLSRMQAVLADKSKGGSPVPSHKVVEGAAKNTASTPPPSDSVLSNFFNSLLTKKPGSASSTPGPSPSRSPPPQNILPKKSLAPRLSQPGGEKKINLILSPSNPERGEEIAASSNISVPIKIKIEKSPTIKISPAKAVKRSEAPSGIKHPITKRGLPQLRK